MTVNEFQKKVNQLLLELNTPDKKYNIFLFVYNIDTKQGFSFGYGCPGCAAEAIQEAYDNNELVHNTKSEIH
jgi:hypothetical protein